MEALIRAVRPEDWPKCKELRLAALRDPMASIAFLETYVQAAAKPDEHWRERAAGSRGLLRTRQFVAEEPDGRWTGSVTALVERAGADTVFGGMPEADQTHLVGVFVRPERRGTGIARALLESAVAWSWSLDEPRVTRVRLYVHEHNTRARACYEKAGFTVTGATVPVAGDERARELELAVARAEF
ncbi:GNAT family N-acetyltransferase [Streptomyces sp. NPDC048639]|uniref:GNAT family N-acetyltransferase n=1 Tax=Streptomyces sp. NPDC048639 TaxID=3365581 RepID=UPI0037125A7D